jgi:hypothetical protein
VIQGRELTRVMMSNLFWLTGKQMERLKPFSEEYPKIRKQSGGLFS